MSSASTPPSISPWEANSYASLNFSYVVCPRLGNLVPGPSEPKTKRGFSGVENESAHVRAIFAPSKANS
ncbi:unannotated protein [freshwater metagenome]|uniref:Unannotated protein n=1 Tax=freshwater metagenome TaxID=449393 RepID=A0A6J7PSB2_9ZZZZ